MVLKIKKLNFLTEMYMFWKNIDIKSFTLRSLKVWTTKKTEILIIHFNIF